jgi:nucleoside-diphosphate-sugar epimerase
MKYVLIGGSGFIGQHFKNALQKDIILNLDINSGLNNSSFEYCDINKEINYSSEQLEQYTEICVIHLAAVHFDFQKSYYQTNVEGTKNVLNWISAQSNITNYVFFSSVATYGDTINEKKENDQQNPYNDYGKSKLDAEKIILKWVEKNRNIKVTIVRPAVVFGEYNFGNVFNFLKQIQSGLFAIIGDGKNIKSIAYAPNLVNSVIYAVHNISEELFIYNYSDYPQLSIEQQSKILSSLSGKSRPIKIPLLMTKFFTLPVDFFEKILGKDLKINSMRVKKFTVSTYFNSDLIRNKGYIQQFSIEDSYERTIYWMKNTSNLNELRNKWYNRASKL